jgi:hypothetical protein
VTSDKNSNPGKQQPKEDKKKPHKPVKIILKKPFLLSEKVYNFSTPQIKSGKFFLSIKTSKENLIKKSSISTLAEIQKPTGFFIKDQLSGNLFLK